MGYGIQNIYDRINHYISIVGRKTRNNSAVEKIEDTKENIAKIKVDLEQDHIDSITEFIQFKNDSDLLLQEHEQNINNLKNTIIDARSDYELQLAELDIINVKLKLRIKEFKEQSKKTWEEFKHNFNNDIDELGKSITLMAEKKTNSKESTL